MRVPSLPNITAVNELGDFGLAADRLAFIDGEGTYRRFLYVMVAHQQTLTRSGPMETIHAAQ
jgi:hypothetical protein